LPIGGTRGDDREDLFAAFNKGKALQDQGKYREALPFFERALKLAPEVFGAEHENTATILNYLGMVYEGMGQYAKAEPLFRRSLDIRDAKFGKDHPEVAASLNNLGILYEDMGQYAKAEPLLRRSLEINEAKLGKDHRDVAISLNNLANLYWRMGQYAKAEPLYRRSLEIRETKLGKDHPEVAESVNSLAVLYKDMGQYANAEPLYRRSLEIRETKLGQDHPDVATSLNNLALLYSARGQYAKAEPLYRRSLEIREAKLAQDHPNVADSLNNLALLYSAMGQYAKAEPLYRRSLEIREAKLAQDHPNVAQSLNNLAMLYKAIGQYAKAEPLYRRSLEILEAKLGKDHPDVASALNNLANLYDVMGQYDRAERLYRRSLEIREAKLGKDHPEVARSLYNLAQLDAATSRWQEAAQNFERSRRIDRRVAQRTLLSLAEKDQLEFLTNIQGNRYQLALSLGLTRRADDEIRDLSTGWVLNGKGIAQESLALRTLSARDNKTKIDADPWVTAAQVRQVIAKDTVLIEFARFKVFEFDRKETDQKWSTHYAAWIIQPAGKGDVQLLDLGQAEKIDTAVAVARKALQAAPTKIRDTGEADAEKDLQKALREVAALVLHPLEEHIGQAERWLLSPDAALWLLPWGALPLNDGSYAIEKHPIQLLVSGRDLARPRVTSNKPSRPIILADPDFDLEPAAARSVAAELLGGESTRSVVNSHAFPLQLPAVSRLPGTAAEAKAIEPKLGAYAGDEAWVYRGKNALETIAKAIERPRVLVFSTHGFFLEDQVVATDNNGLAGLGTRTVALTTSGKPLENPLRRCGLLLAGCNRRTEAPETDEDGVLTGEEIVGCDLRGTELVVLSACETGLGQVNNGEGVAGLRQAFQLAGARSVVATLWQVPDRDTALLMIDFFDNLAKKQPKAEALRNAQLARIKARRDRNGAAHPFFWAAFTITGQ
jgi:CHAT domain-containing protein